MMSVIGSDQGNMRKIQSRIVSRLVSHLGVRWSSSLNRGYVGPLVQEIVVTGGIAGVDSDAKYKEMKAASVKGDYYLLQSIQHTQNKTVKKHRDMIRELIVSFFEYTSDPMLTDIKSELFGVERGNPIVGPAHHVVREMMALDPPYKKGVCTPPPPSPSPSRVPHTPARTHARSGAHIPPPPRTRRRARTHDPARTYPRP